jgi:hypothetical protein
LGISPAWDAAPSNTIVEQLKRRTGNISSTEVIGILGVSRKTLCKWALDGTIKAYRFGKDNYFDPVELAVWIEA